MPFARDEYVAPTIRAYFNLDLAQINGFGFPPVVRETLVAIALLKIRRFLNSGLRLRTACDLECQGLSVTRPQGFQLPALDAVEESLPESVQRVHQQVEFEPLRVRYSKKTKK